MEINLQKILNPSQHHKLRPIKLQTTIYQLIPSGNNYASKCCWATSSSSKPDGFNLLWNL